MQRTQLSTILAATLIAAAAGQAAADTTAPLTREQVRAELQEARRTGDIVEIETGRKLNQIFPSRYVAQAEAVQAAPAPVLATEHGKTRAEVLAELAEARRTGNIVDPETQLKLNQIYPSRYPAPAAGKR